MSDNKRGQRATLEQLEFILEAVEKKPSLQVLRQAYGVETVDVQHWKELVDKLNTMGSQKTIAKWQKTWRDYRLKTKKKAAKLLEEQNGDDASSFQGLTDLEVRILNLDEPNSSLKIIKTPEINISKIPELDPLSSEDSSDEPLVLAPNMVTVYNLRDDQKPIKREHSPTNQEYSSGKDKEIQFEKGKIKKRRIEFRPYFNSDRLCKDTSEILQSLKLMEESRRQSDEKTHALLNRLCVAMETGAQTRKSLVVAMETQTKRLKVIADSMEQWMKNGSGT